MYKLMCHFIANTKIFGICPKNNKYILKVILKVKKISVRSSRVTFISCLSLHTVNEYYLSVG